MLRNARRAGLGARVTEGHGREIAVSLLSEIVYGAKIKTSG